MSYIDVLLYTRKNDVRVEQELQQMNDVFKLTDDINQEMIQLDENYTKDMWFNDIADRVFAFKQRIHNWLKEGEMLLKFERKSKSSGKSWKSSLSKSSKSNSTSSSRSSGSQRESNTRKGLCCGTTDGGIFYEGKLRYQMAGRNFKN